MNKRHPFKWKKYKGHNIRIDKDIVPLLEKMWALGIGTTNSCQRQCSIACDHKYKEKKLKCGCTYSQPVRTKYCLNSVWIAFESVKDIERFYNIVAEYASYHAHDSMYHKMGADRFVTTRRSGRKWVDRWAFDFLFSNQGVDGHWGRPTFNGKRSTQEMWIEDGCKKNKFVLQPQITFPRTHLKYVEERLDAALKRKRK